VASIWKSGGSHDGGGEGVEGGGAGEIEGGGQEVGRVCVSAPPLVARESMLRADDASGGCGVPLGFVQDGRASMWGDGHGAVAGGGRRHAHKNEVQDSSQPGRGRRASVQVGYGYLRTEKDRRTWTPDMGHGRSAQYQDSRRQTCSSSSTWYESLSPSATTTRTPWTGKQGRVRCSDRQDHRKLRRSDSNLGVVRAPASDSGKAWSMNVLDDGVAVRGRRHRWGATWGGGGSGMVSRAEWERRLYLDGLNFIKKGLGSSTRV
jgi:hypothetical protein